METTYTSLEKINNLISNLKKQESLISKVSTSDDFSGFDDSSTLIDLRTGIRKSTIINLYTVWESFIKEVFFETIYYNQKLLNNQKILSNMISKVNSKSFLSKNFYNLDDNKIILSKKVLTHSNNMSMNSLCEIINDLDFSKEDFYSHLNLGLRSSEFPKTLDLKDLEVNAPVNTIDNDDNFQIPSNSSDLVKFYYQKIFELVKFRNNVAHSDKPIDMWSVEIIITEADILKSLILTIDEFLIGQILKKSNDTDTTNKILVTNAFPALAVLEIDPPNNIRGKNINDFIFFAKDRQKNIFRKIKIDTLKNNNQNICKNIPIKHACSIKISSINLWTLNKKKENVYIYSPIFNKVDLTIKVEVEDLF